MSELFLTTLLLLSLVVRMPGWISEERRCWITWKWNRVRSLLSKHIFVVIIVLYIRAYINRRRGCRRRPCYYGWRVVLLLLLLSFRSLCYVFSVYRITTINDPKNVLSRCQQIPTTLLPTAAAAWTEDGVGVQSWQKRNKNESVLCTREKIGVRNLKKFPLIWEIFKVDILLNILMIYDS